MKQLLSILPSIIFLAISCSINPENATGDKHYSEKELFNTKAYYPLFVGTYTRKEGHVDGKATGIYWMQMDTTTGKLKRVASFEGTINPSYLTLHPNGKFLYVVNEHGGAGEFDQGTVSTFSIDRANKKLNLLNIVSAGGVAPCYISLDNKNQVALVANYVTGNVSVLPIKVEGSLAGASSIIQHEGKGNHPRQEAPHAHMIVQGPDATILAVDLGADKIFSYQLKNGALEKLAETTTEPEAGPRHLAFHPNEKWIYVLGELNGKVEAFNFFKADQPLKRFQTISTTESRTNAAAACADIHVHPDGRFLYASNRGDFNSIAMYAIHPKNGRLQFLGTQSTKGTTPRNFVIDPTGKFLLVANQDSDNIVTFKINQTTGLLEDTGLELEVFTPVCLKFLKGE